MSNKFVLNTAVSYKDVDREETLLLSSVFKLLQEAAIRHANQFDTGTHAAIARGESWVLNRLAVAFHRYPRHEESIQIETWSTGVQGFRGYRDYRIFVGDEIAVSGSSLWLYIDLKTKSLIRVPAAIAESFPSIAGNVFEPGLDKFSVVPPGPASPACSVSLRYSDYDSNGHVNNTSYFDFLQTALVKNNLSPKPARLQVKFLKEIRPEIEAVKVNLETRAAETIFSISGEGAVYAEGQLT